MRDDPPRAAWLLAVLVLLVPASLASQNSKPPDVPALLKSASEALDRKDYETAVKALTTVTEVEPEMTAAWFNLGYALTGLNRNEEAIKAYQKTLQLQPDLFEARLNYGILLMQMNKPAEAALHLEEACELKPEHARAHLYYGRALAAAGKPLEGQKQLEEALRLDPSLESGLFDLGQTLLKQKDYAGALAAFTRAAELDPKFPQAHLGRALALQGLGRPTEAAESLEKYLAAAPDDLESRFHLAQVYLDLGQNEKALEHLQAVYTANPRQPGIAAAMGDLQARQKKYADAEKFYREAVTASPQTADLRRVLGQTLMHLEKYFEAEKEFLACLKLDPRNLDAFRGVAMSLYLQKKYPEAIPLFEKQASLPNPPAAVFFILATCYDHLHVREKALENYERFLQMSKDQNPDQEWQAQQRAKLLRRELRK